jgi:hypothetical protein
VLGLRAYALLSRVEALGMSTGDRLVIDMSAVTDLDLLSLVSLRQVFDIVLWQGIHIELDTGTDGSQIVARASRRLLDEALASCVPLAAVASNHPSRQEDVVDPNPNLPSFEMCPMSPPV